MGTGNQLPVPPNQGTTGPQAPELGDDGRLPNEIGMPQQEPIAAVTAPLEIEELLPIDGNEYPVTPPAAPAPQEPPLQPPPATAEEVDFDAIMARFKNDPRELAKSWLHAQAKITEQEQKIAAPQTQQPQQAPLPQPQPQEQQQVPPGYEIERDYIRDPSAFRVSERGFPINPITQQEFLPVDQFNVPFTPDTRWQAIRAELNEQYPDNPVEAMYEYQRQYESQQMWRNQQHNVVHQTIGGHQDRIADEFIPRLTASLATYFPQEIAAEMVSYFRGRAGQIMGEYRASGQPLEEDSWQPDAVARLMNMLYFEAFNNGTLLPLAEQARGRLAVSGRIPLKGNQSSPQQGQVPQIRIAGGQGQVLPPPTGNNGVGTKQLPPAMRRMREGGVFKTDDEAARYLAENFDFDDVPNS